MKRIDKIISEQTHYTRTEIKKLISQKKVYANDELVKKPENKYDENSVSIKISGQEIEIRQFVYLLLNKPKGYISATEDRNMATVLDLVPSVYQHRNLFPAGRLDKDTTGLMIITDDGDFAHNILSPKKHVKKEYMVVIDIPITDEMIRGFNEGVKLIDGNCKPSKLEKVDKFIGKVTLVEGRYHQIKRMFGCYGAKVLELKRICMGNFYLPDDLKDGECREFTTDELKMIR